MLNRLRVLAFVEALSFLVLLFIAMPLKYLAGQPEAVRVAGTVHGVLFLAYVAMTGVVGNEANWPSRKLLFACLLGAVPFGPFIFDRKLFRS